MTLLFEGSGPRIKKEFFYEKDSLERLFFNGTNQTLNILLWMLLDDTLSRNSFYNKNNTSPNIQETHFSSFKK
jgi:hypothetical protein